MNEKAFLFPGQGAQSVGMGASLVEASPRARAVFERARDMLDEDLLAICLEGPEETLDSTRVSQPAIFLMSMAVLEAIEERAGSSETFGQSLVAAATAGLSLGEYSALVFAGSLRFEDALRVVSARGKAMQEACDRSDGGMTSLIGLEVAEVERVIERAAAAGKIGIANYNSPTQTVISGERAALEAAAEHAKELGCRRVVPLRVAGAYHSPLMATATEKLAEALDGVEIRPPRCPFYSNVTGGAVKDPDAIRDGLVKQVESPVRWTSLFEKMVSAGVREALEVGPGNVLRGLARSIDRDFTVTSVCEIDTIEALISGK